MKRYEIDELEEILLAHYNWARPDATEKMIRRKANLSKSDLSGTYVEAMSLPEIDISGSDMRWCRWIGVDIIDANMRNVVAHMSDFSGTDFSGTDLSGADFRYADLTHCNFTGAILNHTNFGHTKLYKSNMAGLNLRNINLIGADLRYADLSNTNLYGVDLRWCNLSFANLEGTNLCRTSLISTNMYAVRTNSETLFDRADFGGAFVFDRHIKDASKYMVSDLNLRLKADAWY